LWGYGEKDKGNRYAYLNWTGSSASGFDLYRDGKKIATVFEVNDYTDALGKGGNQTFTYRVCEKDTQTCSNFSPVNF
jgi:hypothetical protein